MIICEMKSYADLEQSKKLAEILPIESADMYYSKYDTIHANTLYGSCDIRYFNIHEYIPCWSLAALLEMLPTIDDGNRNPVVCKDIRLNKWHIVYYGTAVEPTIDSGVCDNSIDACVEMIVKLKEKNLI